MVDDTWTYYRRASRVLAQQPTSASDLTGATSNLRVLCSRLESSLKVYLARNGSDPEVARAASMVRNMEMRLMVATDGLSSAAISRAILRDDLAEVARNAFTVLRTLQQLHPSPQSAATALSS